MKKIYIVVLFLVSALMAHAEYYNVLTTQTQSYVTMSFAGGIALNTTSADPMTGEMGGNSMFSLSYELTKKRFFFNAGIGLDYMYTRMNIMAFADEYQRIDRDGDQIKYRYMYDNYKEGDHQLIVTIPLQFGWRFVEHAYLAAGLKIKLPVWGKYATIADMYTEGEYARFVQPISQNVPEFGYYPQAQYVGGGYYDWVSVDLAPNFEIGMIWPFENNVSLRVGAFCEYAIPVVKIHDMDYDLLDYSKVDINPLTQNQVDLQDHLQFNSVLFSHFNESVLKHSNDPLLKTAVAQNLLAGIRLTLRFNVTKVPQHCNCDRDYRKR